jgi:aminopeptidase N
MWFGDLVTMKWWNDLWLNESFAEWASTIATAEATEWTHAWATFQVSEKSWAYRQDQLPSTHPIVATINDLEDVQINFDGITYAKGGSVLKQLVAYVGREAFFTGVTNYFRANAWKNAELADLLRELEKTSKRDLTTWSAKWLETAGVNTLTPEIVTDDDGIITSFDIVQTAIAEYPTIRPHRLAVGIYAFQGSDLVRTHRVELDIDGERTTVTDLIGQHRGALVLVNDDDLAYAKIRLDGESLAMAIDHLSDISDPLARALVWGSAWDSTRDAEMAPSDFVDLVLGNIATESESTTVRTTLAQLATTARMYVSPDRRENTIRRVADAMLELAENAEPGSDQQFQFLRTFASMADTAEHAAALRSIRSGERVISGIAIDTDLSWDLLEGMVLAGGAGESEIAEALAADNTSNGQQAAARLRATIPTAEAKRKILETMRDDTTIANSQCDHYVRGYTHVNDPSVFENLVSEYFDAVQTVWDSRTFKIAEYFAIGLYPAVMATESLGSKTRAWLDSNNDAPSALRRIVIEGLATVDRALAAQRRDAEVNR